jgi:hypothetical protein
MELGSMELGFAYHHSKLPKHARQDFEEMLENNCNSVLISASENDLTYWYPNMVEIVEVAKDVGLKVWFSTWALGGIFGGESPSVFLHDHHKNRQITAESRETVPAACINSTEFRDYFFGLVRKIVKNMKIDGVFIDEPHYYWVFDPSEFTCVCDQCRMKYEAVMGSEMPFEFTHDVRRFRENNMHEFLVETCETIKKTRESVEVCVCIIPADLGPLGTPDWNRIAGIPEVDMFSTDPYYHIFGLDRKWAIETAQKTIEAASKHGKQSQLWLQMFRLPKGEEQAIASLIPEYASLGVDSIFGWSYLANKGTSISSDNPDLLWNLVLREFRKLV